MEPVQVYDLIGELALGLRSQGLTMRYSELRAFLAAQGAVFSARCHLGLGRAVAAAWRYWDGRRPEVAACITWAFTGSGGEYRDLV
jgi:hypothetical protein